VKRAGAGGNGPGPRKRKKEGKEKIKVVKIISNALKIPLKILLAYFDM
jgi:hypothetical protein